MPSTARGEGAMSRRGSWRACSASIREWQEEGRGPGAASRSRRATPRADGATELHGSRFLHDGAFDSRDSAEQRKSPAPQKALTLEIHALETHEAANPARPDGSKHPTLLSIVTLAGGRERLDTKSTGRALVTGSPPGEVKSIQCGNGEKGAWTFRETKQESVKPGRKEHAPTKRRGGSGASVKTQGERGGQPQWATAQEAPPLRISGVKTRGSYSRPLIEDRNSCLRSSRMNPARRVDPPDLIYAPIMWYLYERRGQT
jgi:hypothetical protein